MLFEIVDGMNTNTYFLIISKDYISLRVYNIYTHNS